MYCNIIYNIVDIKEEWKGYTRVLRVVLLLGTLQVLAIYSVMTSLLSFAAAAAPYSHRKPTNKPTFDFVHSTCRRQRTRTLLHLIIFYYYFYRHYCQCRSFPSHSAYLLYRCTIHATKTAVGGFLIFLDVLAF